MLEVRLSAHQGTVNLDTVAQPVSNFLIFGYELLHGKRRTARRRATTFTPHPLFASTPVND